MASTIDAPAQAVAPASAAPAMRPDGKTIAKLVVLALGQLTALMTVDVVAALFRRRSLMTSSGRRLRNALAKLGPMFDKAGQLQISHAAVQPGSLLRGYELAPSPTYKAVSRREVDAIVKAELGAGATFATFADEPFRITALAQLHKATLADGTAVAVKVRRPAVDDTMDQQRLAILMSAWLAGRMLPEGVTFDRMAFMAELGGAFRRQLDFRNEAANLSRMAAVLAEHGVAGVVIPVPVDGMASERVLVTTLLEGTPLDEVTDPGVVADLAGRVAAVLFAGATYAGFFNADLRPANLVARADGTVGIVGFEDCCTLSDSDASALGALFAAVSTGDPGAELAALDHVGAIGADVDRRALLARLTWLRQAKGDVWGRDPLHGVPHLFRSLQGFELTIPVPLLRLAENVLHLEGVCRRVGGHADLVQRLSFPPQPPDTEPVTAATVEEIAVGAVIPEPWTEPSLRALSRMVPDFLKPNRSSLKSLLPLLLVIPINAVFGLRWALGALIAQQLAAAGWRKVRGEPPKGSTKAILIGAVIFGGLGIVLKSQLIAFLPQLLPQALGSVFMFATLLVGRPVVGLVAQRVWPQAALVREHPSFRRRIWVLSLIFCIGNTVPFILSVWLLTTASVSTYLVASHFIGQFVPLMTIGLLWALKRTVRKVPAMETEITARAAALAAA